MKEATATFQKPRISGRKTIQKEMAVSKRLRGIEKPPNVHRAHLISPNEKASPYVIKNKDMDSLIAYHNSYGANNNVFGNTNLSSHKQAFGASDTLTRGNFYAPTMQVTPGEKGIISDAMFEFKYNDCTSNIRGTKRPSCLVQPPKVNEKFECTVVDRGTLKTNQFTRKPKEQLDPNSVEGQGLHGVNTFFFKELKDPYMTKKVYYPGDKYVPDMVDHLEYDHVRSLHPNLVANAHAKFQTFISERGEPLQPREGYTGINTCFYSHDNLAMLKGGVSDNHILKFDDITMKLLQEQRAMHPYPETMGVKPHYRGVTKVQETQTGNRLEYAGPGDLDIEGDIGGGYQPLRGSVGNEPYFAGSKRGEEGAVKGPKWSGKGPQPQFDIRFSNEMLGGKVGGRKGGGMGEGGVDMVYGRRIGESAGGGIGQRPQRPEPQGPSDGRMELRERESKEELNEREDERDEVTEGEGEGEVIGATGEFGGNRGILTAATTAKKEKPIKGIRGSKYPKGGSKGTRVVKTKGGKKGDSQGVGGRQYGRLEQSKGGPTNLIGQEGRGGHPGDIIPKPHEFLDVEYPQYEHDLRAKYSPLRGYNQRKLEEKVEESLSAQKLRSGAELSMDSSIGMRGEAHVYMPETRGVAEFGAPSTDAICRKELVYEGHPSDDEILQQELSPEGPSQDKAGHLETEEQREDIKESRVKWEEREATLASRYQQKKDEVREKYFGGDYAQFEMQDKHFKEDLLDLESKVKLIQERVVEEGKIDQHRIDSLESAIKQQKEFLDSKLGGVRISTELRRSEGMNWRDEERMSPLKRKEEALEDMQRTFDELHKEIESLKQSLNMHQTNTSPERRTQQQTHSGQRSMSKFSGFTLSPGEDDNLTMSVSDLGTDTMHLRPKFPEK